jgi:hypothetical protein
MTESTTTAVISLLHEPAGARSSAMRLFRERPVLAWTLERLSRAQRVEQMVLICWEDQQADVNAIAGEAGACVLVKSPRTRIASVEQVSAAQRWSDGWRGGLLGTCHFDRGFHAAYVMEALKNLYAEDALAAGNLVLLIDPASALVDANLVDAMVAHADGHSHREFFFTQAAPGLAGVLFRAPLLERLAKGNSFPGRVLSYSPDLPGLDPVTNDMCVAVPPAIARTMHRFALDSDRQIQRITEAAADLNGHLIASDAQKLVAILDAYPQRDAHPREVVLELTTQRAARPIFAPATHLHLGRGEMKMDAIARVIEEVRGVDDLRLTLGGAGDPLLHSRFADVLKMISEAGIAALHVETDLLEIPPLAFEAISESSIDILSIHLPAATAATYQRVMGIDGLAKVIDNLKRLLAKKRALPLVVPTFMKCRENLAEMEAWYDHWIRVLGAAVICGPTDFAGQIPDCGVADMSPPRRRPCARLVSRMTILSNACVASCEQDVLGKQAMGCAKRDGVTAIWQGCIGELRKDHEANRLAGRPLCGSCKEWHRP